MKKMGFLALSITLAGCAFTGPLLPDDASQKESLLRTGDYVVYAYSGSQIPVPVFVEYKVEEVNGLRVQIRVKASMGEEERRWIQEFIDTTENKSNNRIEALYEEVNGEWKLSANPDNRDLMRLYSWTLPNGVFQPKGKAYPYASSAQLGDSVVSTRCMDVDGMLEQIPSSLNRCESDSFPWTHIDATIVSQASGKVLWKVFMESYGNIP